MSKRRLFSYALFSSSFLSFPLSAECIPSPDCADLGYDQTACPSSDSVLKCPFDTAKLKCIPQTCESIGKKTCGDMCVTDSYDGCCVGDIYYSDKTCSPNLISGKTPIGVVGHITNGGKNGIVVEKNMSSSTMPWGCKDKDLSCIINMPGFNGGANAELRTDYNGKANTACMVSNGCTSGTYCNSRNVEGVTGWYLPAGGELYDTMTANRTTVNAGLEKISGATKIPTFGQNYYYWSSSERSANSAWCWAFGNDGWYCNGKDTTGSHTRVRCVLDF